MMATHGAASSSARRSASASASAPRRTAGAVLPDGRLNVSLLQREIASDITDDARYRAEDDMKKRAIHSSKDYDEFRKFVSASQLRPVGRSEVADLFTGAGRGGGGGSGTRGAGGGLGTTKAPRNKSFRTTGNGGGGGTGGRNRELAAPRRKNGKKKKKRESEAGADVSMNEPCSSSSSKKSIMRTPAAFEREWRRRGCCRSSSSSSSSSHPTKVLSLLADLSPEDVPTKVFRVEIDADVLGGVVGALGYLVATKTRMKESPSSGGGNDDDDNEMSKAGLPDACLLSRLVLSDDANGGEPPSADDSRGGDDDDEPSMTSNNNTAIAADFVYRWMVVLPKCGRFGLAAAFLDDGRREDVGRICDFLLLRLEESEEEGKEGCRLAKGEEGGGNEHRRRRAFTRDDVEGIRMSFLG